VTEFQSFRRISKKFKLKKRVHVQDEYNFYIDEFSNEKDQLIINPLK
jgi:hypothetical protein